MKLSKQERIGVLIIAVVIIIGLGIFFFIVPKFEEVGISKGTLESKQSEYQAAVDKASLKDGLKDQVIAAYEEGRDLADMFFEEMTPYELDAEVRLFLENAKAAGHNVVVESLSVSEPSTGTLSVSFFNETELNYDLKAYATQGQQPTEEELAAEARRATLMSMLSSAQTVGASNVSFTVTAMEEEDIIAFIDYINDYKKTEDGKEIRKALMYTSGLSVSYKDVTEKYDLIITDMKDKIEKDAEAELKKNHGDKADIDKDAEEDTGAANNNDAAAGEEDDDEDENKVGISDCIYSQSVSLTFYFIERMQDPTDLLEQQDAA